MAPSDLLRAHWKTLALVPTLGVGVLIGSHCGTRKAPPVPVAAASVQQTETKATTVQQPIAPGQPATRIVTKTVVKYREVPPNLCVTASGMQEPPQPEESETTVVEEKGPVVTQTEKLDLQSLTLKPAPVEYLKGRLFVFYEPRALPSFSLLGRAGANYRLAGNLWITSSLAVAPFQAGAGLGWQFQ
jgi:hypothetical protein